MESSSNSNVAQDDEKQRALQLQASARAAAGYVHPVDAASRMAQPSVQNTMTNNKMKMEKYNGTNWIQVQPINHAITSSLSNSMCYLE